MKVRYPLQNKTGSSSILLYIHTHTGTDRQDGLVVSLSWLLFLLKKGEGEEGEQKCEMGNPFLFFFFSFLSPQDKKRRTEWMDGARRIRILHQGKIRWDVIVSILW